MCIRDSYASFLPKPLEGASGSGLHVNLSLCREGCNLFDRFGVRPKPEALGFTAVSYTHLDVYERQVLDRVPEGPVGLLGQALPHRAVIEHHAAEDLSLIHI